MEYFLFHRELPKPSKEQRSRFFFLTALLIIVLLGIFKTSYDGRYHNIIISEVCRKTTIEAESDEVVSYIVLKNIGATAYEINGLSILDDEENRLSIDNMIVEPGEEYSYMIADNVGFNIKKKGGTTLYLADAEGNILESLTIPALTKEESYKLEGDEWKIVSLNVSEPVFSADSGFYEEPFELSISADDGVAVYYTLDSSIPTAESTLYETPIYVYDKSNEPNQYRSIQNVYSNYLEHDPIGQDPVDKCFVVRAVAIDRAGNMSDVVTSVYFIGLEEYKDKKVVSLVSDPEGLFGDDGIYVTGPAYDAWYQDAYNNLAEGETVDTTENYSENFYKRGMEWERQADFKLFDDGQSMSNQLVGIRIRGNAARNYPLKRFSIYSRGRYSGSKWFDTNLFESVKTHSVVLREGTTNAIAFAIAEGRDIETMVGEPIILFLDGEYWNTMYLYEKYGEEYFATHYGVSEDNVIIAKNGVTDTEKVAEEDSFEYLTEFISSSDMADAGNYMQMQELMDVQSYIDFWAVNIYLANMDLSDEWNIIVWRTAKKENKEYGDTRWRWGLYDMDLMTTICRENLQMDVDADAEVNPFGKNIWHPMNENIIWAALVVNPDFCEQFVVSFMDIVNTNFTTEHAQEVLEKYDMDISWNNYFFQERAKYIVPYMAEYFGLTGTQQTVTLSSNVQGAPVTLNTITPTLSSDGTWSGSYFTDYTVTATAVFSNFDHWEVTSADYTEIYTEQTIEVSVVEGGVEIHAVFK
jgi:hypothetical protein